MIARPRSSQPASPFLIVALVTVLLLLVPLVAMQVTDEVNWAGGDFVVAGALIFAAGSAIVLGTRRVSSRAARVMVVAIAVLLLAFTWAQLALA